MSLLDDDNDLSVFDDMQFDDADFPDFDDFPDLDIDFDMDFPDFDFPQVKWDELERLSEDLDKMISQDYLDELDRLGNDL